MRALAPGSQSLLNVRPAAGAGRREPRPRCAVQKQLRRSARVAPCARPGIFEVAGPQPANPGASAGRQRRKGKLMPVNPADRPVAAGVLRSRGMKRLSAVTAGVGVAGVLATGAIAFALPGSTHNVTSAGTADELRQPPRPRTRRPDRRAPRRRPRASASGTKSSVSTTSSGSSSRTDATSGGS